MLFKKINTVRVILQKSLLLKSSVQLLPQKGGELIRLLPKTETISKISPWPPPHLIARF